MSDFEVDKPFWKAALSLVLSLIFTVAFIYFGLKFLRFFMPFVIGWFIAYIASPLVKFLEAKIKMKRKLGSAIIIILVLAGIGCAFYFAGSKVFKEISSLLENLPQIYRSAEDAMANTISFSQNLIRNLPEVFQEGLTSLTDNLGSYVTDFLRNAGTPTFNFASNVAKQIPSTLISIVITMMSAYFFVSERDEWIVWSKKVAPEAVSKKMSIIISNLKMALGGYFKAQFKIMAVVFCILLIGFIILSVPYYVLLALIISFLDFLPFFGTGTALIPWAIYLFMTGEYKMAIGLVVIYVITQLVRQLIQPKLVGDSMGLNPLMTLVFLYIGLKIGSVIGMILAVPAGMIIINLYKAGGFDYILNDAKIIWNKMLSLYSRE
ncbi:sporulation integral membrane protein YtvI [Aequitasia blattaphilus]|uniref:Sporulation integral membrane protein YtvI n=1 Tax=Aequitasia blattaphilus TaxID=2949332 RepID=A0ABT1E6G8_9FIRM|nr:sporulation integral membrane protein YtvI [Aequitasia blattaphilus]MCP1101428.1 sporulation integral membrane protein YtvI [Aequitasia blattaphilus]MCR8614068.1 sporulation integral membrane protein YtvI [Aequitasia blattaphilus]